MKLKVKLSTVNDAMLFSAKCGEYTEDIDYICGRYILDAKSLMGVLSVGLWRECGVEIHTNDNNIVEKFMKNISMWTEEEI